MADDRKELIVVVGFGWVGQANAIALARMGYTVFFYDIITPKFHYASEYASVYDRIAALESLFAKDGTDTWYLVCVGDRVGEDGVQDISIIAEALDQLKSAKGKVILRSTLLPSCLQRLPFDYYLPEFLHEVYAVEECVTPFYFVLGARTEMILPVFLREWKARARKVFVGTPEEASYIKYLSNIWNAVRIAFVNEFGDAIADPVDEAQRKRIERILDFILERKSYLRYGREFGGHCLPKDMRAFMRMAEERSAIPLLRGVYAANMRHAVLQDKYRTLPQWFSSWEYTRYAFSADAIARWWGNVNSLSFVKAIRTRIKPAFLWAEKLWPFRHRDIKRTWERFAKRLPYYYAYPDAVAGKHVDEFDIRKTGESDYRRFIADDPVIHAHVGTFGDMYAIEIGAGVGRMTEYMAKQFRRVAAVDVSSAMLAIAKKRLANWHNIVFLETSGSEIPEASGAADFIFSYGVLRHMPSRILVEECLKEMHRTLKSGGIAKVHLRTGPNVHRWHWFYGVSLSPDDASALAETAGFEVLKIEVEQVKHLWLWLKKVKDTAI